MPSIRHELEITRTARWYLTARGAQRGGAWGERVRCYAALSAVLAEHAARDIAGRRRQPPIQPRAVLTKVARRAHFASAEPVYRRWRHKQDGQPIVRWAGRDPAVKPGAALVAEAKITAFWPYREGVIKVADAFDMTPAEWAAAYLRALAAWAGDDRPLAACHPAGPPECVIEDMAVLAASPGRGYRGGAMPAAVRAARLRELAGDVVRHVLDDGSITPLGAFNTVRDEVHQLLAEPLASPADQVVRSVAELSDRILHHGDGENVITAEQASHILGLLDGLSSLLAGFAMPGQDPPPGPAGKGDR